MWLAVGVLYLGVRRAALRRPLALAVRTLAIAAALAPVAYLGGAIALASPIAAGVAIFPASLNFPTQTVSTTTPAQNIYLTDIGADALTIASITATGDFSQANNCGTTVGAGASCIVSVSFTPTAVGARSGTVTIVDGADGSPHTITLNGTGQAAPSTTGGTPAGSYTLTISGTVGTLSNFGTLTLTVQ
jgi:hypothetical protein